MRKGGKGGRKQLLQKSHEDTQRLLELKFKSHRIIKCIEDYLRY